MCQQSSQSSGHKTDTISIIFHHNLKKKTFLSWPRWISEKRSSAGALSSPSASVSSWSTSPVSTITIRLCNTPAVTVIHLRALRYKLRHIHWISACIMLQQPGADESYRISSRDPAILARQYMAALSVHDARFVEAYQLDPSGLPGAA